MSVSQQLNRNMNKTITFSLLYVRLRQFRHKRKNYLDSRLCVLYIENKCNQKNAEKHTFGRFLNSLFLIIFYD